MLELSPIMVFAITYLAMGISFVLVLKVARDAYGVHKKKTVGSLNPVPYMAMFSRTSTYVVYCYISGLFSVMGLSIYGATLSMAAMRVLFKYTPKDERRVFLQRASIVILPFFIASICVMVLVPSQYRLASMDVIAIGSCCGPYFFPLKQVVTVVRTKSGGEALSPSFLGIIFVEAVLWTLYGLIFGSVALWGPCLVGIFISLFSIWAALMYKTPKDSVALPEYSMVRPGSPGASKTIEIPGHSGLFTKTVKIKRSTDGEIELKVHKPASPPASPLVSPPCSHGSDDDVTDMV